ncbi:uncharacterized protein LOC125371039 [Ricinus communis]|uniref:uncharacterized protein LOC125371039 n=1 Tax=Ricinus communis TaxID=3988 RepID=UPI00201B338A|nr:uncharacterized protein LOC125371039 [Ricinus communis]
MRMSLISKNKITFVDGSIKTPDKDDATYSAWERFDVWEDLKDKFSQSDIHRLCDLQEEIYGFKQNNLSVNDYYTHLKMLWDELSSFRPIPKFLKGLNENFSVVKSQIKLMDPLPPINKVFSMVLQHERVNNVNTKVNIFYSRGTNYGNKLFKKPGYSYGGSIKKPTENASYANHVEAGQYTIDKVMSNSGKEVVAEKHKGSGSNSGGQFPFTQEQYQRIVALIQTNANAVSSPTTIAHVNTLSTKFVPSKPDRFPYKGLTVTSDSTQLDHSSSISTFVLDDFDYMNDFLNASNQTPTSQTPAPASHIAHTSPILHDPTAEPLFTNQDLPDLRRTTRTSYLLTHLRDYQCTLPPSL